MGGRQGGLPISSGRAAMVAEPDGEFGCAAAFAAAEVPAAQRGGLGDVGDEDRDRADHGEKREEERGGEGQDGERAGGLGAGDPAEDGGDGEEHQVDGGKDQDGPGEHADPHRCPQPPFHGWRRLRL
jgi:hypothetical protein